MEHHLRDVAVRTSHHLASHEPEPASPARLRELVAMLPTPAMLLELDRTGAPLVTASNALLADFIGAPLPADAPVRQVPMQLFLPDRRTPLPTCMLPGPRAIHRGEAVRDVEVHVLRPDGTWRAALVSAAPVRHQGRIAGALVTFQDITTLRDADDRRNQFLAVLGHELRNPLMPIISSLAILDRTPADSPPARRALGVIGRQVTQLTRLVDDLLDVVRVARGKIRLQRERIDLGPLVARTADDHRDVYAAAGIALDVRVPDESLPVLADPARLSQIIGNLLHNAAKFTAKGQRVLLQAERREADVALLVRDEGSGIRSEVLPHIFEPFVQADDVIARKGGGLGLGLPLVKALVELHEGRVIAESGGPGRGTTIAVYLPADAPLRLAQRAATSS